MGTTRRCFELNPTHMYGWWHGASALPRSHGRDVRSQMIKNQKQLRTSKRKLKDLDAHRDDLLNKQSSGNSDVGAIALELGSVDELRLELRSQIRTYEELANSNITSMHVQSLPELPQAVLRARIAAGLTQAELAERAGLAASAIERYERNDYESASLQRLAELIEAIGIPISVGHTSARQAAG